MLEIMVYFHDNKKKFVMLYDLQFSQTYTKEQYLYNRQFYSIVTIHNMKF